MPKWDVQQDGLRRGIDLINNQEFFEAHEVLEDVWRESTEPEKTFLQGLIQLAVAFHHHSQGNQAGAKSLLARSQAKLSKYPEDFLGIDVRALCQSIEAWQTAW